jgi:hypothetical protein
MVVTIVIKPFNWPSIAVPGCEIEAHVIAERVQSVPLGIAAPGFRETNPAASAGVN